MGKNGEDGWKTHRKMVVRNGGLMGFNGGLTNKMVILMGCI